MSKKDNLWEALGISKKREEELWDLSRKLIANYNTVTEIIKEVESKTDLTLTEKLALLYALGHTIAKAEVLNDLIRTAMGGINQCA